MITRSNLEVFLKTNKIEKFRIKQILNQIYINGKLSFDEMNILPQHLKLLLNDAINILDFDIVQTKESQDKTVIKYLCQFKDGTQVECVLMRFNHGRNSACISSQVGCAMGCTFCSTGKLKLKRNLTTEEILSQIIFINSVLIKEKKQLTNIVFMGMGEPFLNYNNVISAIEEITSTDTLNLSPRRITISTCGIIEGINKLADYPSPINLALSLHSADQTKRESIMPIAKAVKLPNLLESVDNYTRKTNRRVSFEYILINKFNDSESDASDLAKIASSKLIHVNLIPYNRSSPKDPISAPSKPHIRKFAQLLQKYHVNVTIRLSMGDDISAACGQLANKQT